MNNHTLSHSHAFTLSRSLALTAFLLVLAGMATKADTSFTSTGWLTAVPLPGITVTNSSGQVYVRGNAHVVRLQADDPRVTGRLEAWMDLARQPDGTALFSGPAYCEVGTWDSGGTNFTPTGGTWALNYSGVLQADGSAQYSMAGYGIGGVIEGLRINVAATRASPGDASTPYLASGTIKPAPVNSREVVDDFGDNDFTWSAYGVGPNGAFTGTFFVSETNQQLTIGGTWPDTSPRPIDASAWANPNHDWTVSAGQTMEARVDVIALSPTAAGTFLALWHTSESGQAYLVVVGRNFIVIGKEQWTDVAFFPGKQAHIKDTNIVLSLALTPLGMNVVVTGTVLDKDNGAVIAQVVTTDTPDSDPTLSASELAALTGGRVWSGGICTDPIGPPFTSGVAPLIALYQESDVAPVTAFGTFDNLELRTYEVPAVGIEPAVRLSWPNAGMNFAVEAARTVNGPWLPVQNSEPLGFQQMTVRQSGSMEFFRLVEAP